MPARPFDVLGGRGRCQGLWQGVVDGMRFAGLKSVLTAEVSQHAITNDRSPFTPRLSQFHTATRVWPCRTPLSHTVKTRNTEEAFIVSWYCQSNPPLSQEPCLIREFRHRYLTLLWGHHLTVEVRRITNFYQGAPLNRLSWLRESSVFLNAAAETPRSKWLLFRNGEPLVVKTTSDALHSLSYLTFGQIKELLGDDVKLFGQGETKEAAPAAESTGTEEVIPPEIKVLQGARLRGPTVVFLGVKEDEGVKALPTNSFKTAEDLTGTPYFGLDVSRVEASKVDTALESTAALPSKLVFMEPRSAANVFDDFDAPVFSIARSMVDWNARNRVSVLDLTAFYGTCYRRSLSLVLSWMWIPSLLPLGWMEAVLFVPSALVE